MEVHFTGELQARLDRVAAEIHSGADEYVQQLVENSWITMYGSGKRSRTD